MAQKKLAEELSPEDQEILEKALEAEDIYVDSVGHGLRGPDPHSPFYDLWKKQNGKK